MGASGPRVSELGLLGYSPPGAPPPSLWPDSIDSRGVLLIGRYFDDFYNFKFHTNLRMNKIFGLFTLWLSFFLKKSLFGQVFEFFVFLLCNLVKTFKSEARIRRFFIRELVENRQYAFVELLFFEYHLVMFHLLPAKYHGKGLGRQAPTPATDENVFSQNLNCADQGKTKGRKPFLREEVSRVKELGLRQKARVLQARAQTPESMLDQESLDSSPDEDNRCVSNENAFFRNNRSQKGRCLMPLLGSFLFLRDSVTWLHLHVVLSPDPRSV